MSNNNYINYVNIKQGTQSVRRFSNGNTLPLTQMPFGMAAFAPQTEGENENETFFYHPQSRSLEGVRLTHQPSPWIGDYGHFVLMPQRGTPFLEPGKRWSGYNPKHAILSPHYMKLDFLRYEAIFELTPTERGAVIDLTFEGDDNTSFAVLPVKGFFDFNVDLKNNRLTGYTKASSWSVSENFAMSFILEFDCAIDRERTYILKGNNVEKATSGCGEGCGISVGLSSKKVRCNLSISFIDQAQAKQSMNFEIGKKSFDDVKNDCLEKWESLLSKIEIESNDIDQLKTFYSCMYRLFLFPRKFYEIDHDGSIRHFCPDTGQIASGVKYVDNGFWDTFRTLYPLYSIIIPDQYAEILEGFINTYKNVGWLPKWTSPCETGTMPGSLIDALIADAAVKGIVSRDLLETALEGMIKHSTTSSDNPKYGRLNPESLNKVGYLTRENAKECVNNSLDAYYGNYCIGVTAKVLGKTEIADKYFKSSKNYSLLFDKESGFMRSRDLNGDFNKGFDPFSWGGDYCEGSAFQNSFAVFHDIKGLAELYGGKSEFLAMVDKVFSTPPLYKTGGYNLEIHEMTEMASADFGQCAISNQPSFHLPFLYAALGECDKTDYWVKRLVDESFSWRDDGFPGDEDNGSMSAWYVFATLGFYPLCPGEARYISFKPLVNQAIIHTQNGSYALNCKAESSSRDKIGLPIYINHNEIVG